MPAPHAVAPAGFGGSLRVDPTEQQTPSMLAAPPPGFSAVAPPAPGFRQSALANAPAQPGFIAQPPSSNMEAAQRFADALQQQYGPGFAVRLEPDPGGSVYAKVFRQELTKSGQPHGGRAPRDARFKARFADHGGYYSSNVSVDPTSGNTVEDALRLFDYHANPAGEPPTYSVSSIDPATGAQRRASAVYNRRYAINGLNPAADIGDWEILVPPDRSGRF